MNKKIIIDATEGVLGRVASFAAKQAVLGKQVVVVNCNHAIILGSRSSILEKYQRARARGGAIIKGPHFPKEPEKLMKRTIRGMLKYKRGKNAQAFKTIRCYNEIPEEYKDAKKFNLNKESRTSHITLEELGRII